VLRLLLEKLDLKHFERMVCEKIKSRSLDCNSVGGLRYYQRAVIVNKADVRDFFIWKNDTMHRVSFSLFDGKSGFTFLATEKGASIVGVSKKTDWDLIPEYQHSVSIIVRSNDEASKVALRQLDVSNVFVALLDYSGGVEVFGFEYGMSSAAYEFNLHDGGVKLDLTSRDGGFENENPFLYFSKTNAIEDFNNEFANIASVLNPDYNDDYNDDFFV
jgi:hypothetical protein